jgi:2-oxoglutarate/2-oxoacid ferredoxin oxidoreductase subunit beta
MSEPAHQIQDPGNRIHLIKKDYEGSNSTLCRGCGHDAITASIITAAYEANLDPKRVIKLSGIGCSAKTANYFMNQSFGFNGIHGRMAAMATGAGMANHTLVPIGVSGDGDTASIGLGNFAHMVRRNLRITYIVENNGVYGLTKGQFSATADRGTRQKRGAANPWDAIDIPMLALMMGATFVARSFSGDRKQLAPLLEAALNHKGTAVLDVLSPCVTFNDHEGSTKSLKNIRANRDVLHDIDFIPDFDQVQADYAEGSEIRVRMHDAGMITLHKLKDHDPRDRGAAMGLLEHSRTAQKFVTGLIYIDENRPDFAEIEALPEVPLAFMDEDDLRPSREALESINASLML